MLTVVSIHPNTVNVLIGPNGSGKSRLLRHLCIDFLHSGYEVIAIAPTIYDRFRQMPHPGLRFFGARQGRRAATKVIRSILERASLSSENLQLFKNLTRALEYTNFDPHIGIRLSNVNFGNFPRILERLPPEEAENLKGALLKWQNRSRYEGVVSLRLNAFSFEELDSLTFALLARHDDVLRWSKTVSQIEYLLYRKSKEIPLLEACSGEICFITTIAFISSHITSRCVIAIDEPDTSLHPTWQREYVKTLLDLFYQYQPRILISTHSPIIISAAEYSQGVALQSPITVYQMADGEAQPFDYRGLSLEAMYDRLFALITPKNHYLSQRAVELLNELNSGDRNLEEVLRELAELRVRSYDASQKEVLTKVEDMARRLHDMKETGDS